MEGGTVAKAGRLKRYAQRLRELVRVLPVAPQGDDVYNAWTTLYGTPDIERILPTYEEYSRNAYNGNAVVFGLAVRRLMLFAEASLVLRDDEDKSLDDDPCLEMLETPWPNGTSSDLLARMIQDVDLAGNAYVRNCGDRLERLRPDWVTIVSKLEIDPLGREVRNVLGYMYEPLLDMGRKTEFYDVSEVAHWAPIPDPTANFRGMSWLTPVVREINADIAMSEHQYSYFRNAATPNLIIKYATELKKGALEHIRDQIAARHAGSDNAFSTMVLDKGADPILVGSQLTDVSFGAIQAAGENRIAVAAGVPAIVAGLKEGLNAATLANFREAMEVFANLTMRPLWRSACAALATIVNVPEGKELWYDTSDIAALQQGEQAIAATMQTNAATLSSLISAGFTPESSVKAVTSGDMTLLEHTGLYSVQLHPAKSEQVFAVPGEPGAPADPNAPADGSAAPNAKGPPAAPAPAVKRSEWRPELHPRGDHGRFSGSLTDLLNPDSKLTSFDVRRRLASGVGTESERAAWSSSLSDFETLANSGEMSGGGKGFDRFRTLLSVSPDPGQALRDRWVGFKTDQVRAAALRTTWAEIERRNGHKHDALTPAPAPTLDLPAVDRGQRKAAALAESFSGAPVRLGRADLGEVRLLGHQDASIAPDFRYIADGDKRAAYLWQKRYDTQQMVRLGILNLAAGRDSRSGIDVPESARRDFVAGGYSEQDLRGAVDDASRRIYNQFGPVAGSLHRGMYVEGTPDEVRQMFSVGKKFGLPVASFTGDEAEAIRYSGPADTPTAPRPSSGGVSVVMTLPSGSRTAVDLTTRSALGGSREVLLLGQLRSTYTTYDEGTNTLYLNVEEVTR